MTGLHNTRLTEQLSARGCKCHMQRMHKPRLHTMCMLRLAGVPSLCDRIVPKLDKQPSPRVFTNTWSDPTGCVGLCREVLLPVMHGILSAKAAAKKDGVAAHPGLDKQRLHALMQDRTSSHVLEARALLRSTHAQPCCCCSSSRPSNHMMVRVTGFGRLTCRPALARMLACSLSISTHTVSCANPCRAVYAFLLTNLCQHGLDRRRFVPGFLRSAGGQRISLLQQTLPC